jgi:hypothetical protein
MPVSSASSAPSPICQVRPFSGSCSTVWPWNPSTSISPAVSPSDSSSRSTRPACARVSSAATASIASTGPAPPATPRSRALNASPYSLVRRGPNSTNPLPSVRSTAASMPSIDVPLISPRAVSGSGIAGQRQQ